MSLSPADTSCDAASAESLLEPGASEPEASVFSDDSHPAYSGANGSEARYASGNEREPLLSMRESASQSTLDNGRLVRGGKTPGSILDVQGMSGCHMQQSDPVTELPSSRDCVHAVRHWQPDDALIIAKMSLCCKVLQTCVRQQILRKRKALRG